MPTVNQYRTARTLNSDSNDIRTFINDMFTFKGKIVMKPFKKENIVGVAIDESLNAHASVALEGWMHGWMRGYHFSACADQTPLRQFALKGRIVYFDPEHDFTQKALDGLNAFLKKYVDKDDPKPYLCDLERSDKYLYVGMHMDYEE